MRRILFAVLPLAYLMIAFAFIYLPVLVLVLFSFQAGDLPVPPFNGPSLRWYEAMFANDRLVRSLINSIVVALGSATAATGLGLLAAYSMAQYTTSRSGGVRFLIMAPMTVSYIIIGMGLMTILYLVGVPKSLLTVAIGHVVVNLPLAFAIIYSQFGDHLKQIDSAARDLGAGDFQTLSRIIVPIMRPAIFAAFCLSATLSWDEYIIALLVSRFEVTLPVMIIEMLRGGLTPIVNAAGTVVFAISMGFVVIAATVLFFGREGNR